MGHIYTGMRLQPRTTGCEFILIDEARQAPTC